MASEKHQFNLPEFEEKILKFWEEKRIFELTLTKTKNGKLFVFYEGPPTANGVPGIHHVEARAFKDLIPRYKTMRGFYVPRKAGWDTHGLPVEIQVEKELGLKNKQDIEAYGIAPFNAKAKESVWRYKEEWDRLTKRMGFWLDLKNPYITYDPLYMESLWWIIKEFWNKKLLVEDFKIVPWCTRCQTGLSTHELAQGYRLVKDKSVYVKFKLDAGQKIGNFTTDDKTYILAWTTTPWTLPGNVALAINTNIKYERVTRMDDEKSGTLFVAAQKRDLILSGFGWNKVQDSYFGKDFVGIRYEPLFCVSELQNEKAYRIYVADFVTAQDGTGVVHTAVMYGEDDYKLGKKIGLPTFHTVDETGRFVASVKELVGLLAKNEETEKKIISLLSKHGNLFVVEPYEHDYPFCWRCGTPLLYYARKAWWVRTTEVKKELLANNETINWVPDHLKKGRFGEFLKDVRDWAFSRERYWGTPLPIWKCNECAELEVMGSIDDLRKKSVRQKNAYLLMRHGEAFSNIKNICSSKGEGQKLTLKGRSQVEVAARKLKKQTIDMIVSSPIPRAKETADMLGKILGVPVHADTRLGEINVGIFDGMPTKNYHAYFSSLIEKFTKRPPEGEHLGDVRGRALNWIQEMEKKHSGKKILVVSHEYPLWMMFAGAQGLTNTQALALRIGKRKDDFIALAEVMEAPYVSVPRDEMGEINLHRPFVDEFTFSCAACKKGTSKRVPEVVDVWFDSGAMPYGAAHYPFEKDNFAFPADYISEAVDQTRGWFYTLLAISTLLGKKAPYRHVISLGHVLDKNGQKMSKSKGNVVNPWEMVGKYGIDTLRWYFYSINAPGEPKRFDEKDLLLKQRAFLGTWWNSFVLFDTYVKKASLPKLNVGSRHVLDVWVKERLNQLVAEVTDKLEAYDVTGAARAIEQFTVSDFSQWYLRRSRERFQRPRNMQEKKEASETTAYVLDTLCRLTAPFTPFLAEYMYQELRKKTGQKEISIHLRDWPWVESGSKNKESRIIKDMEAVRAIVAAALKLRAEAGMKVRQPLNKLQITNNKLHSELLKLIQDEVNVKQVVAGKDLWLDTALTPELKEEGMIREFSRNIQEMRRELGLTPAQKAKLVLIGDDNLMATIMHSKKKIQKDTNLSEIRTGGKKVFRLEREIKLEEITLWIGIS
ncbi:MAG: class I tRNA ligase family protein [bacterium]|nr:class I tRNA ligase family protein [bacterium]MDZ4285540.1 class I tRNA ligase family protein [Candidatus Sungbacteria bacterium]